MKKNILKENNKISRIANAPVKKQIGFFSAMIVVVGSCIGSGIFFKAKSVLTGSENSIILAMACWIFVAIAVLCMALALIEIAAVRSDNLSILGWSRSFNNRFIYKMCKNYIFYLYTPIRGFFLPIYVILAFQDAVASIYIQKGIPYHGFGTNVDWLIIMFLAIAITTYFIVSTAYSIKLANAQSWIITSVKFIPLAIAAIVGFIAFASAGAQLPLNGGNYIPGLNPNPNNGLYEYTFNTFTGGFGFFIAASAILYAYDGFYTTAGIKSQMKEPKKSPVAILIGLIITTIIYLAIAISMSLGSTAGNPQGLVWFFAEKKILWLYATFQMIIAIGIFGVANGYYMFANRMMEDLIREGEVPFSIWAAKHTSKYKRGDADVAVIYNIVISIIFIITLTLIGSLAYINTTDAGNGVLFGSASSLPSDVANNLASVTFNGNIYYTYGTGVGKLYTFTDMISSWSALFIFLFVILILYGGLRNRKHEVVKTNKTKTFIPATIISMIFIAIPVLMTFIEPFVNLFFLIPIHQNIGKYQDINGSINTIAQFNEILIARIMAAIMLIVYWGIIIIPILVQDKMDIKKYGSIEKATIAKYNEVRTILNLKIVKTYKEYDKEARHSAY
ncbi:MAG: APC family permease [Ureaplasma sp.]|nr:APC family permease [Ureaplasma sp.]MDE7221992.1 APC family permease [Ureaplasma sp.]